MATAILWQKSSFSGGAEGNECVEVASIGSGIRLRESDEPSRTLSTTQAGLAALIRHVRTEQA